VHKQKQILYLYVHSYLFLLLVYL